MPRKSKFAILLKSSPGHGCDSGLTGSFLGLIGYELGLIGFVFGLGGGYNFLRKSFLNRGLGSFWFF